MLVSAYEAAKLLTKLPYPKDWIGELGDRLELINDPDARAAELRELAYGCYRSRQVTYDQMDDMLELIDAARWWAFNEREETWVLGVFKECEVDDGDWGVRLG